MRFLSLFIVFTLFFGCKTEPQNNLQVNVEEQDSLSVEKEDVSKIQIRDIAIDIKAKPIIESWQPYLNVSEAIDGLRNADLSFFNTDVDLFNSTVKDLEQTIPSSINTDAVQSRVLTLKTMLFKLEDILTLNTTSKTEKLVGIKDVFTAFSNLNLQINKKLEKDSQTIEKPY